MIEIVNRLEAIEARLAKATPGPWSVVSDGRELSQSAADADFIAHSPDDLRLLLAVARAAMELRELELRGYTSQDSIVVVEAITNLDAVLAPLLEPLSEEVPK